MAKDTNKVRIGFKNAYFVPITTADDGKVTYGTPVAHPGSVSLSIDASGDENKFFADDIPYYVSYSNAGYEGSWTIAKLLEKFRVDILGEKLDTGGAIVEYGDAVQNDFALIGEIGGDKHPVRVVLFNCKASRPNAEYNTKEDSAEPSTEEVTLTISPRAVDNAVKAVVPFGHPKYDTMLTTMFEPELSTGDQIPKK